ncbi:SDR family oxidoreductase [bacterium]|nr:SDR family oxidoreductase [bacterium]
MNLTSLKGRTALVTGASSGLGSDFARHLAEAGCHLVLTARREELLKALQQELSERHGVRVEVVALDLGAPGAPDQLYERLAADGIEIDVLVNNAGFGLYGDFLDIPWERERAMLELDILALVHLTKRFAKDMVARKFGYILQVSSIGAYQPTPTYASYSAAKSFVLSFGEALNHELKGTGVSCTVLSPGVTATAFLEVSGQAPTFYQRLAMMRSPEVTRIGLQALLRRQSSVVPGLLNAVTAWSTRLMPRPFAAAVAHRLMR